MSTDILLAVRRYIAIVLIAVLVLPLGLHSVGDERVGAQTTIPTPALEIPDQENMQTLEAEHDTVNQTQLPATIPLYQPGLSVFQENLTSATSLAQILACPGGSVLTIVPHEDDDILFMNPDLQHTVQSGRCITTVYLTAGDAGSSSSYWMSRERGAEAAYSSMLGSNGVWRQESLILNGHQATISHLDSAPQVALIFFRLPDGNLDGRGFAKTGHTSLQSLYENSTATLQSVDYSASYDKQELTTALRSIIDIYRPTQIQTLDYSEDLSDGDHSDHHAAGAFTKQALQGKASISTLRTYMGYPAGQLPENVSEETLTAKKATFRAYGVYDGWVCHSDIECETTPYQGYLTRQYSKQYAW